MTTLTYIEINKKIAALTHELREYRLKSVLKTLVNLKIKSRQIVTLEAKLCQELHKTLHNPINIDDLLDDLESVL